MNTMQENCSTIRIIPIKISSNLCIRLFGIRKCLFWGLVYGSISWQGDFFSIKLTKPDKTHPDVRSTAENTSSIQFSLGIGQYSHQIEFSNHGSKVCFL